MMAKQLHMASTPPIMTIKLVTLSKPKYSKKSVRQLWLELDYSLYCVHLMTCNTFYMIMLMKTWHELLCMSFFVPMSHDPTFSTYFWVNHFNYFSQLNALIYETLLNWMKFLAKLSYFVILMLYHSLRIPITLKANKNNKVYVVHCMF